MSLFSAMQFILLAVGIYVAWRLLLTMLRQAGRAWRDE